MNNVDMDHMLNLNVTKEYKRIMMNGLRYSFPTLGENILSTAMDYIIKNSYKPANGEIKNNYTNKNITGSVVDILRYIEKLEPIKTSSGVLFKKHKESINPLSQMIMGFLKQRKMYKKEMFTYPKGSADFEKFNLLQLLEKLNANATYGCIGAPTSLYYNVYIASSVTAQGRSYISSSIMLFESLLANNVKFNSLNEIITFIDNVVNEKNDRKFDDSLILEKNISRAQCIFKILNTADPMVWIPTELEMSLVCDYINGLSQEDVNRIYYKNNLYEFCDLKVISDIIVNILCTLESPFMNPNEAPNEIKDMLVNLTLLIKEYVYYKYPYIDKLDRIEYMQRDIVAISDTDSTIISFDGWYRYILDKVYSIDMPIKHQKRNMYDIVKADEFGDRPLRLMYEKVEPRLDYDFYTDEVIELQKLIDPCVIVPQDGLRFSIINLLAYVCSDLVVDYLTEYTKHTGSYADGVKCRMVMKNEFFFASCLLTNNRRNYADVQILQEGNIIPDKQKTRLAIMGLPINKSTLSDGIKSKLQKILYEDILTASKIDQIHIMKKLILLENEMYKTIMDGSTEYYKPDNIAAISSYSKGPLSINGIVASMVYNELRDPDMPAINLEERNKIFKVKIKLTKANVDLIKDTYPEVYERMLKILDHPTLKAKLETIAFPYGSEVPKWILPFVDVSSIINDNLKNFPLPSVGLKRLDNDSVNYSNIINL